MCMVLLSCVSLSKNVPFTIKRAQYHEGWPGEHVSRYVTSGWYRERQYDAGPLAKVYTASYGLHASAAAQPDQAKQLQGSAIELSHPGVPEHARQLGSCVCGPANPSSLASSLEGTGSLASSREHFLIAYIGTLLLAPLHHSLQQVCRRGRAESSALHRGQET